MKSLLSLSLQVTVLLALALSQSHSISGAATDHKELFQTSDRCFACHNGLSTSTGEDISIGLSWRPTMMANSARDPYWQAGVRRETIDHPGSKAAIEDECATCHMPMARYQSKYEGKDAEVFSRLAFGSDDRMDRLLRTASPVRCATRSHRRSLGPERAWSADSSWTRRRARASGRSIGPYKIEDGQNRIMRSSSGGYRPTEGEHIRKSELCATCHTLITKALGPGGQVIGELPEQMPYQEWFHSEFRDKQSCQSCHMPAVEEEMRIAVTLGLPREKMAPARFRRWQFLHAASAEPYRNELGVDGSAGGIRRPRQTARSSTCKAETAKVAIDQIDARGWPAAGRHRRRESERPQVPDRLSVAPGVAARHGQGSQQPR